VTASEVFRFREEYLRNRNLRAWTFVNPSRPSEIVDVILSEDLDRMEVERFTIRNQAVRVASIAEGPAASRAVLLRRVPGTVPPRGGEVPDPDQAADARLDGRPD
jgi:hypothetical protein